MCLVETGFEYRILCKLTTEQANSILAKAPNLDHCDESGLYEYRDSGSLTSMPDAVLQRAEYGLYFCDYSRSRTSLEVLGYALSRCADIGPVTLQAAD
ncbi:hypothetical protein [Solirubrum puertoriconensis]|uniref:Uncharacterized protein n=1 Tax=Solirubrum puertoriconensis TaxID=1751427 RepID=A0A9X0HIG6_SOLP1|nr:hypothetical protein [Solirubrum puertoriconensis]KUG06464.1 hypothetical protein ASU33_03670 [Solirubrum puertoriconensis]